MDELDQFVALERQVWIALAAGDPVADAALLTEDFVGVYPSGFSDRAGHCGQLAEGPTIASFEISAARLLRVSSDAVMLSYHVTFSRPARPEHSEQMYVSSLWVQRQGEWRNLFSQDTPIG